MRERELREAATCVVCGKKIGETGFPCFYRLHIERHGLNADAIRRQIGFTMMMGSAALAAAMGPDEEMTRQLMDPVDVTVCETCSHTVPLMEIALRESDAEDAP